MAAPTNTVTSLDNIGQREDLEDDVYRIAPEDTPFTSAIGTMKVKAINHEWQVRTLATPDPTNAALEGDDVSSLDAANLTTRMGNICQIFDKTGGVSRTQEVVDLAGRDSELEEQKMLKGLELRTDIEARAIGNYASNAESGATARKMAGALAFITSNDSRGAGGSDGGWGGTVVAAATNGTQRTFAESQVKSVIATGFNNGGKFKLAFMGMTHKQQFGAFTGIADIRADVKGPTQATIIGAADVYVSDAGNLTLVPVAYGLTRDCLFIDPKMAAIGTLDGIKSTPLAKTGDNDRFLITAEKTLIVKNQKALGVVADLT